jgi:hypothetical protein
MSLLADLCSDGGKWKCLVRKIHGRMKRYKILIVKPERKGALRRPNCIWEVNGSCRKKV